MEFWFTRDKYGTLFRFDTEPVYDDSIDKYTNKPLDLWTSENGSRVRIGDENFKMFPEIVFKNSPVKVVLKNI